MAVVYNGTLKTNRMQLVPDLISSLVAAPSTGVALAGQLVIGTVALSGATGVLGTITLSATAGTVVGPVFTLSGTPLATIATASGTAALAEFRNNGGTTVVSGLTVGTVGTDIIIGTTVITIGETLTCTAGTITHG